MFKKILILVFILIVITLALLPVIATRMAINGFNKPEKPGSDDLVRKAIQIKMYMLGFKEAGIIAEKGIIFFPESPHLPNFIYTAAVCAEKQQNFTVAVHWFQRFLEIFPEHEWAQQARNRLNKYKDLQE